MCDGILLFEWLNKMRPGIESLKACHRVDDKCTVLYYSALAMQKQRSLVPALFDRYSLCLKVLVLLILAIQFVSSSAHAQSNPRLVAIPPQIVIAEQLFTHRVEVEAEDQQLASVRLLNAPNGAKLSSNGDGSYELSWTPPASVDEQTVIIVQAFDVTNPRLISTQRVVLQRGEVEATQPVAEVAKTNNAIRPRYINPNNTESTEPVATVSNAVAADASIDASNTTSSGYTAELNSVASLSNDTYLNELASSKKAAASASTASSNKTTAVSQSNNTEAASESVVSSVPSKVAVTKNTTAPSNPTDTSNTVLPESVDEPSVAMTQSNPVVTKNTTQARLKPQPSGVVESSVVESSVESSNVFAPAKANDGQIESASTSAPPADETTIVESRPTLPEIGVQQLTVGEEFQFFIRPVSPNGAQVQLSTNELPPGATFNHAFEGSKLLLWRPVESQVGEHRVMLTMVAKDENDLSLVTEREIIFIVNPRPPVLVAPVLSFEPLSAQIVSAGRKINIRVTPIASDDTTPFVHVDRLPAGGSFDENKDGSRTFHWPTTQADQGEHTFQFTAIHSENADLVATTNVLIVIGSPDGPGTQPNLAAARDLSPEPALEPESNPSEESFSPEDYPSDDPYLPEESMSPEAYTTVEAPSPENPYPSDDDDPYPSANSPSPEPLAVRPPPQPRPSPDP